MVDPSFDPSSGHATGIPRGPVYPLIKNIPIKELKTCRRRRRRRRRSLDRDHSFHPLFIDSSISISIDRSKRHSRSNRAERIESTYFHSPSSSPSFHRLCPSNE